MSDRKILPNRLIQHPKTLKGLDRALKQRQGFIMGHPPRNKELYQTWMDIWVIWQDIWAMRGKMPDEVLRFGLEILPRANIVMQASLIYPGPLKLSISP